MYCLKCGHELESRIDVHGEHRNACPSCTYVHYDNPVPVVAAVVERDNHVILVRGIGWPPSWHGVVTGFLEKGEKVRDACVREVKEELGLDAEIVDMLGVYDFLKYNQVLIAFHVRVTSPPDTPIVLDTSELEGYQVVPIHRLRPFPGPTGQAIAEFLKRFVATAKL